MLHHPNPVVSPVDVVNLNVRFTPLRSRIYVVKLLFYLLRVYVLKTPTIFIVNTGLPPNVCNVASSTDPTHRLCKAPQYTHTAVANNPKNTSYLRHTHLICVITAFYVFFN